jgi:hypothetical protein
VVSACKRRKRETLNSNRERESREREIERKRERERARERERGNRRGEERVARLWGNILLFFKDDKKRRSPKIALLRL